MDAGVPRGAPSSLFDVTPRVVVVGLGPGHPSFVTAGATEEIARATVRFVRTTRHPTAALVPDATSFDDSYERYATFEDVYASIVETLVLAAITHGEVLYAVPGSPLVLEDSVDRLRRDPRVETRVLPAVSFLDLAWCAVGTDPVSDGVRLIDGHRFEIDAAGERGPMLVAQVHDREVLSRVKLSHEVADGDEPVTILHHLGLPDERVVTTTWSELDRTIEPDHLTAVWIPRLAVPVAGAMAQLHALALTLRERCPWDREQTHDSLVRYLVEETYELVDALHSLDPDSPATVDALVGELGDLLYQVEFHAVLGQEAGLFTIADVARSVHDKLIRRHPHVFGDASATTASDVESSWERIKQAERGESTSPFAGVVGGAPALAYAEKVQRRATSRGFDWRDAQGPLDAIADELVELRAAAGSSRVSDELGDLLFSAVNAARHLGVDPEAALRRATNRFRERVERATALATDRGIETASATQVVVDGLWRDAKASLRADDDAK